MKLPYPTLPDTSENALMSHCGAQSRHYVGIRDSTSVKTKGGPHVGFPWEKGLSMVYSDQTTRGDSDTQVGLGRDRVGVQWADRNGRESLILSVLLCRS